MERMKRPIPYVLEDSKRRETFNVQRFLGRGGFAECYKVKNVNTGLIYAAKLIYKTKYMKTEGEQKLKNEVKIHDKCIHENIALFHCNFEFEKYHILVLEYCSNGSLNDLIFTRRFITPPEAKFFLYKIMLGLSYLHMSNIIHRDLKPANILLDHNLNIKIADFGCSILLKHDDELVYGISGTVAYQSPEVHDDTGHSKPNDIWAVGCILYFLIYGKTAFRGKQPSSIRDKIKLGIYKLCNCPTKRTVNNLIKKMLEVNEDKRPTVSGVLKDKFLIKGKMPAFLPLKCLTKAPLDPDSDSDSD